LVGRASDGEDPRSEGKTFWCAVMVSLMRVSRRVQENVIAEVGNKVWVSASEHHYSETRTLILGSADACLSSLVSRLSSLVSGLSSLVSCLLSSRTPACTKSHSPHGEVIPTVSTLTTRSTLLFQALRKLNLSQPPL